MIKTIAKIRHDRLKSRTEESGINRTVETVTFNMSLMKRVNPDFYKGIMKLYDEVPYFIVEKPSKEKDRNEDKDENNTESKTA